MWQTIRDHLRDDPTLNDLVQRRIYVMRAPENTPTPYVTMQLISKPRAQYQTRNPRYQFNCYDPQYGRARQVADAVSDAIKNLEEHENIFANFPENDRDRYENDTKLFSVLIDAVIYFKEE